MKKMKVVLALLLAILFSPLAVAAETPAAKSEPESLRPPVTTYEISVERKLVKDEGIIAALRGKIEGAEAFKASDCKAVDVKGKKVIGYRCAKPTCKTDELFRSAVEQPGFRLLALTSPTTCPTGCFLSSRCTGGLRVTCCRIPVPAQYCPGYAP